MTWALLLGELLPFSSAAAQFSRPGRAAFQTSRKGFALGCCSGIVSSRRDVAKWSLFGVFVFWFWARCVFKVWNVEKLFRLELPGCLRACSRWECFFLSFFFFWDLVAKALLSHFTDISGSVYVLLVLWNLIPSVIYLHILFPGQQPSFWSQCSSVFNPYPVTKMIHKSINIDPELLPLGFKADPKLINRNKTSELLLQAAAIPTAILPFPERAHS